LEFNIRVLWEVKCKTGILSINGISTGLLCSLASFPTFHSVIIIIIIIIS
jgi:hypothetical protein